MPTEPRQVRVLQCTIMSPGLGIRAETVADRTLLESVGLDILPFTTRIDLYESIFDNTISGTIQLIENIGLVELIPIVGVETVAVVFEIDTLADDGTPGTRRFAHLFRVVALKDHDFPRNDYRTYTLHLATHEFVTSVSSRICRPFRGISCRTAVHDILTTDLKVQPNRVMTAQPTFGTVDTLIPNYTPLRAINYFTALAQTFATPRQSNFLFFETLDGFHFTSLAALVTAPSVRTFKVNPGQVSVAPVVRDTDAINAIMRVHQEQAFDVLMDIASGALRATMCHFDFLARKPPTNVDSRYTETFKQTSHLDKYPVYPDNFDLSVSKDVRQFAVPSNVWSANSAFIKAHEPQPDQRMHEAVVLRNRQLREIKHLQTLLELPGQPDLRSGTVVEVEYPSTRVFSDETSINKSVIAKPTPFHSGRHLVTAVRHIIEIADGHAKYTMHVKVCKDSLAAPLISFIEE